LFHFNLWSQGGGTGLGCLFFSAPDLFLVRHLLIIIILIIIIIILSSESESSVSSCVFVYFLHCSASSPANSSQALCLCGSIKESRVLLVDSGFCEECRVAKSKTPWASIAVDGFETL
jgi:hypothetical protein